MDFLQRLKAYLEEGNLAIGFELQDEDEEAWFAEYNLLTAKPVIYAANVSEDDLADDGASTLMCRQSGILQLRTAVKYL